MLSLTNATITNNRADSDGDSSGAFGAIYSNGNSITLNNTIVAGNFRGASPATTPDDIGNSIATPASAYNLIGSGGSAGLIDGTNNNQVGLSDPILGPLKDNGGPTKTHAPLSNSPAIDRGKDIDATEQDQRGSLRPVTYNDPSIVPPMGGDRSDIGAVELPPGVIPVSAESVKSHGGTPFSIPLPLSGPVGIECRSGGATNDYQIVVTFAQPVAFSSAAVMSGTGSIPTTMNSGNQVTLSLSGVTNAQTLTLALFDVSDGVKSGDVGIRMGMLVGDTGGNGSVNSTDVSQTKLRSGQAASQSNFRSDVNANGVINATDVSTVKIRSGLELAIVEVVLAYSISRIARSISRRVKA